MSTAIATNNDKAGIMRNNFSANEKKIKRNLEIEMDNPVKASELDLLIGNEEKYLSSEDNCSIRPC